MDLIKFRHRTLVKYDDKRNCLRCNIKNKGQYDVTVKLFSTSKDTNEYKLKDLKINLACIIFALGGSFSMNGIYRVVSDDINTGIYCDNCVIKYINEKKIIYFKIAQTCYKCDIVHRRDEFYSEFGNYNNINNLIF